MSVPSHETWNLSTRRLGREVWYFPRLESTNALALSLGHDPAHDGLALLAGEQTQGRGQHGRLWNAPLGSSVLLTLLLFPPPDLRRPALLTAWAAVAVCRTVHELTGLEASIKWPNDILVAGKKVCGILIEQRHGNQQPRPILTAAGIGLNVSQTAEFFAQADLPMAGSLMSLSGRTLEMRDAAINLIEELDASYDRLLQSDHVTLETDWKNHIGLAGQQVRVELNGDYKEGRLVDMTWEGIVLQNEDVFEQIAPERIRHLERSG
jgi:BirA family biotin operon repressor/biotin-[acetyl-CoA-carboxylase] ligase